MLEELDVVVSDEGSDETFDEEAETLVTEPQAPNIKPKAAKRMIFFFIFTPLFGFLVLKIHFDICISMIISVTYMKALANLRYKKINSENKGFLLIFIKFINRVTKLNKPAL